MKHEKKLETVYDLPYSATSGKPSKVKDWYKILHQDKKDFTKKDLKKLQDTAAEWEFCACGNLCKLIPRKEGGAPKDKILMKAGVKFSFALTTAWLNYGSSNWFESILEAREFHSKIEKRAGVILRKMKLL